MRRLLPGYYKIAGSSKLKVGALLKLNAQNLAIINTATEDENYTMEWVSNTAAVTQLLVN